MKRSEVLDLYTKLDKVKGLSGAELNFAIKKNLRMMKDDKEIALEEERELIKLADEYNKDSDNLKRDAATVDGKVLTKKNEKGVEVYDVAVEKLDELNDKLNSLYEKNAPLFKEINDKWEALMNARKEKESNFVLYTIKKNEVPISISTEDMELIFDLIE